MKTSLTFIAASLLAARSLYGTIREYEDLQRDASKVTKKKECISHGHHDGSFGWR